MRGSKFFSSVKKSYLAFGIRNTIKKNFNIIYANALCKEKKTIVSLSNISYFLTFTIKI